MSAWRVFWAACFFEGGMVVLAWALGLAAGFPVLSHFRGGWWDVGAGAFAAVPPLLVFVWSFGSSWQGWVEIRAFLDKVARPYFQSLALWQLAVISACAGFGEEALFRGLIQGTLVAPLGPAPAVLIASLVFALAHAVNPTYALVAGSIGLYLGGLYVASDNLLVPAIGHGLYDFGALVYFLRAAPESPAGETQ